VCLVEPRTSGQQQAGESCQAEDGDRHAFSSSSSSQGNSKAAEGNRPADAESGKSQNCTGRTAQGGGGGECTEEKRPDEKDEQVDESRLVEEGDGRGNDKAAECKRSEGVPSEGADVFNYQDQQEHVRNTLGTHAGNNVFSYQDQQSNQLKALSLFSCFSSAGDRERERWRESERER